MAPPQLRQHGFRGSLRVVTEWANRRRRAERMDATTLHRTPSARTIARLLTVGRDGLSRAETVTVAAVEGGVPQLLEAREVIAAFQSMVRKRSMAALGPWLERARQSLVASFVAGITRDLAAVQAALSMPWSNGQTEGQITKLKLVKRMMYGRGKLDLLEARLIAAGSPHHQKSDRAPIPRRSTSWLQESAMPRVSSSYGYQWWNGLSVVGDQVVERIEAKGLGGQRIFIVPSSDLVVVVTAGLYVKRGHDNEGEITTGILDNYVLPSVLDQAGAQAP